LSKTYINEEAFIDVIKDSMNAEMTKAAEPVIQKALKEIEAEMRAKLGAMLIATINNDYQIERFGSDLRIVVKQALSSSPIE